MNGIQLVFSDFDGTLTSGEDLTTKFFDVLNLLGSKEIPLVIVTGRSKSWAHFFLTHFSYLKYVISEGGGMISFVGDRGLIVDHPLASVEEIERLDQFAEYLMSNISDIELSVDTFGRHTDRAIDLQYINDENEGLITGMMKKEGINYSISSVQINFWCGDISKYNGVKKFLAEYIRIPEEKCIYFGDALNDQSMFENFPSTVGVSNIKKILNHLEFKPKEILKGEGNEGVQGVYNYLSSVLK